MAANDGGSQERSFGMNAFDVSAREQWGKSLRVAMALISKPSDAGERPDVYPIMDSQDESPTDNPHVAGDIATNSTTSGSTTSSNTASSDHELSDHRSSTSRCTQTNHANEVGKPQPLPTEHAAIRERLKTLVRDQSSNLADQIELLVRFDDLEGWRESGFKHCVAWMNSELGVSGSLAWEYLRVGRELRGLKTLTALFRSGSLTWSTVRLISRVADVDSELLLCHAALDACVSDVAKLCRDFRWDKESVENDARDEDARALLQYESRSLTWQAASSGNTVFRLCLPPEQAVAFLRGLEHSVEQLDAPSEVSGAIGKQSGIEPPGDANGSERVSEAINESGADTANTSAGQESHASTCKLSVSQKRADASVLMAERSLAFDGTSSANADRYLVVINTDVDQLSRCEKVEVEMDIAVSASAEIAVNAPPVPERPMPVRRPAIHGAGAIARATARRIACDASLVTITTKNGEPLNISRRSRQWTPAMSRAIHHRDQHCQWPGCSATRHLHIHHVKHWADGGPTSVENGVLCCKAHHVMLHEGGHRFERAVALDSDLDGQFKAQSTRGDGAYQSNEEIALRKNRASFEAVRGILSTRYRFRVITPDGAEIRHADYAENSQNSQNSDTSVTSVTTEAAKFDEDSTRVESKPDCRNRVAESAAKYRVSRRPSEPGIQPCSYRCRNAADLWNSAIMDH